MQLNFSSDTYFANQQTMDSNVVQIFKEDKCPLSLPEKCLPNFTWQSAVSDIYNYSLNESWTNEQETRSPIIPIIAAVYSVVFVVGLVGNCLVMYVIIR